MRTTHYKRSNAHYTTYTVQQGTLYIRAELILGFTSLTLHWVVVKGVINIHLTVSVHRLRQQQATGTATMHLKRIIEKRSQREKRTKHRKAD
jgi:hypothetical protein